MPPKNSWEIENIKRACEIGDEAFDYILGKVQTGVSEKEIKKLLIQFIKNKDAQISFRPIVAFGKNSSTPHHVATNKKLRKNTIVLLDFGAKYKNYCSDMTRTVYFGKAPEKFKKMYRTVLESQEKAADLIKRCFKTNKELTLKEIDKISRDFILSKDYPNMIHSLGHGIGRKVHETPHISPRGRGKLRKNSVFTIEPGIYYKNYGGIRIEDVYVFDEKGLEKITHSPSKIIKL